MLTLPGRTSCVTDHTIYASVIAVPGLGSHAIGSWKSPNSNDVWLRDYLPDDLPDIRVLLYGYDTSLVNSNSKDSIEDLGNRFLESIKAFRGGSVCALHTGTTAVAHPAADRSSADCLHRP